MTAPTLSPIDQNKQRHAQKREIFTLNTLLAHMAFQLETMVQIVAVEAPIYSAHIAEAKKILEQFNQRVQS